MKKLTLVVISLFFYITAFSQEDPNLKDKPIIETDVEFDNGSQIVINPLNSELIRNLDLLGRVWGFLKYYHPEVAKGKYNWDYELFRILPKYTQAKNNIDRDNILLNWIVSFGETDICDACEDSLTKEAVILPDLNWITNSQLLPELRDKLLYIKKNRFQGEHFYIEQAPGIGNPLFNNENPYSSMVYPDKGYRLLALYRYWNMIQYFFPYKYLMDKDWNNTLKEYLPRFIDAKNELEYELAAIEIIGDLKDTHANIYKGHDKIEEQVVGKLWPPVFVKFVENKLVVTDYFKPEMQSTIGLKLGDVITKINGRLVETIVKEKSKIYPASNYPTRLRNMAEHLLRSNSNFITIEYLRNGTEKTMKLPLYEKEEVNAYRWFRPDPNGKSFKFLRDDIGYVTLKNIKNEDIDSIKKQFKNTKGIIVDIRNYPSTYVVYTLGAFFVEKTTPFVEFMISDITNPGKFIKVPEVSVKVKEAEENYNGKLVVLVNEITQSQAEYTAMAFRANKSTTIIGSTTAGADGNISRITLPGDIVTCISGIGVYYPDGTETQRVGIVPDITVLPTIKGIREGRDELIEKAIEVIDND
ncbi:S41 family peptidase [Yeosuana marina]|uniref:S41 family peptidase n=1 Tax=Yeosuana marina TaxID=1565536 RepID=UPI0030ECD6D1|tara:strand:- start:4319 stop:6070 length:1752 start_codon:yes stop_codon:yes gene_type:complete